MNKKHLIDLRQGARCSCSLAVTFLCRQADGGYQYHLGTIEDQSPGGFRVKTRRPCLLQLGQHLELLCLPEKDTTVTDDAEPLRILGRVVWVDQQRQCFGMAAVNR